MKCLNLIAIFLLLCYGSGRVEISPDYVNNESSLKEANGSLTADKKLLLELIRGFNDRYRLRNLIFFISEHLIRNKMTNLRLFVNFWKEIPLVPIVVVSNRTTRIHGLVNTPSLAIILTTHYKDRIMSIASISLRRLHNIKSIFVLCPLLNVHQEFSDILVDFFNWIWREQFTNTVLIANWKKVYILQPYPKPIIINKTDNWRFEDFFVNYVHDMKGYTVFSPFCYDLPRVFQYGKNKTSGTSAKFIKTFLNIRNGSLVNNGRCEFASKRAINLNNMVAKVNSGELEISVHSYMQYLNTLDGTSYPLSIDDFCIIVPFRRNSPEYLHLRVILDDASWLLMVGSVFYITISIWLCTPSHRRDIGISFLQSICSLLSLTPLTIINIPTRRMRFVAILLYILGFILINIYLSKLASRLTILLSDHQIDTVEDVIKYKQQILILSHEYPLLKNASFPEEFMDLLIMVERDEMDAHREHFNLTYGYTIQTDRWELLNMQQRYLEKPLFRITNICLGPFYHVYPLRNESHLYSALMDFTLRTLQSGLQVYWKRETYNDILNAGYARMLIDRKEKKPLTLEFFYYIWIAWSIGLVLSTVSFIMEKIVYAYRPV